MAKNLTSRLDDEIYRKFQLNPKAIFTLSCVITHISAKKSDNKIIVPKHECEGETKQLCVREETK
jgi:hypothetical protein